jgi:uncharacterized protein
VNTRNIVYSAQNASLSLYIAGFLGLISPLPTYAAVPIGLSFLTAGIPVRAVIAFIIASPLMNPSVFFLTATQLSFKIAIARVVAAYVLAIAGGYIFQLVYRSSSTIFESRAKEHVPRQRSFAKELYRTSLFLGKYFMLALFISAAMKALVSPEWISKLVGQYIQQSLVIAIALGVPFYSCGGAAIPIVQVLQDMGMNDGAVLAFFIAGPATKIETMYIFKSMMGIKVLFFYLAITIVGAYLFGLILYFAF